MRRTRSVLLTSCVVLVAALATSSPSLAGSQAASPNSTAAPRAVAPRADVPANPYTANNDLVFRPVAGCRLLNTAAKVGRIGTGKARTYAVAGATSYSAYGGKATGCGIPVDARAVSARLYATSVTATGAFNARPAGVAQSGGPVQWFTKGSRDVTPARLDLGAGKLTIANSAGSAHLAVDVDGYWEPQIHAALGSSGGIYQTSSSRVLSSTKLNTGFYRVDIRGGLEGCTPIASINGSAYFASAYVSGDAVYANTYAPNGTAVDLFWTLHVVC